MKTSVITTATAIVMCSASRVLAASGVREDSSGIFVWIFLGFCALIVVVQVMPALFLLGNFIAVLFKKRTIEAKADTTK